MNKIKIATVTYSAVSVCNGYDSLINLINETIRNNPDVDSYKIPMADMIFVPIITAVLTPVTLPAKLYIKWKY